MNENIGATKKLKTTLLLFMLIFNNNVGSVDIGIKEYR